MSGFWIGVIYAVLFVLLVGLLAYLCERANDDDQWPQGREVRGSGTRIGQGVALRIS